MPGRPCYDELVAAPAVLAYADLPTGSDIRHEHSPHSLRITIPAGEPSAVTLMRTRHRAVIRSALLMFMPLLILAILMSLLLRAHRVTSAEFFAAFGLFGVFCLAAILLLASTYYFPARRTLTVSHQQMTVLAASDARFVVETAGPYGRESHDIPANDIREMDVLWGTWFDQNRFPHEVEYLRVTLSDGRRICVAPGRDRCELLFLANAIGGMTRQEVRHA
jgi:hypothetical protein